MKRQRPRRFPGGRVKAAHRRAYLNRNAQVSRRRSSRYDCQPNPLTAGALRNPTSPAALRRSAGWSKSDSRQSSQRFARARQSAPLARPSLNVQRRPKWIGSMDRLAKRTKQRRGRSGRLRIGGSTFANGVAPWIAALSSRCLMSEGLSAEAATQGRSQCGYLNDAGLRAHSEREVRRLNDLPAIRHVGSVNGIQEVGGSTPRWIHRPPAGAVRITRVRPRA
jgi:hypothetical protein